MDSSTGPEPAPAYSERERQAIRMIPFIVGCALFMQMLDSTVVATALPVMAGSLDSTPVKMNVAITSYLLATAVFVPISGWAADRFGAKRVFVAAILLFTLSSVGCAMSHNLTELVIARVVQGMAGAMMVPVGRIILLRKVPKTELLKAMSFLSLPALLTLVVVNALYVWNDLLIAIIFLQDDAKRTLMAGISVFQGRYENQIPLVMAGMVIASAPMIILYIVFQKYFIRGLMAGAIK